MCERVCECVCACVSVTKYYTYIYVLYTHCTMRYNIHVDEDAGREEERSQK